MPRDVLSITLGDGKAFDRWTSFETLNSIVRSSEASFELGDDGSWDDFSQLVNIGAQATVLLNGVPRMRGRVELLNGPFNVAQASVVRFVVRTVLADMEVQTADPRVRFDNGTGDSVTIGDVIDKVLKLAGVQPDVITFGNVASRKLMTGKTIRGAKPAPDLEPLTIQQAGVQPGETVKAFMDRHLRRHGLLAFDGPNGEIIIAAPDDEQIETYQFRVNRSTRDGNQFNNVCEGDRTQDGTGAPSEIWVLGYGGGKDALRSKLGAYQRNPTLFDAGFLRRTILVDEGVKTKELAERTAARMMSESRRRLDALTLSSDSLTFLDKNGRRIPFVPDTTASVFIETRGGALGKYYIESVALRENVSDGQGAQFSLVPAGTWKL